MDTFNGGLYIFTKQITKLHSSLNCFFLSYRLKFRDLKEIRFEQISNLGWNSHSQKRGENRKIILHTAGKESTFLFLTRHSVSYARIERN